MGSLTRFELARYREHYGLTSFFETGTFYGGGVREALDAKFERVYSVEIIDQYFEENVERFRDRDNVTLLKGHSVDVLAQTLPDLEGNIFFWLDAHFPGADGGLRDYNAEVDESIRCPLEAELETIKRHRAGCEDVFLIDDLRLYERGEFEGGDLPSNIRRPGSNGIDFIYRLFSDSHHIVKLFYDEGYVLMLPIGLMPKIYVRRTAPPGSEIGRMITGNG